MTTETKFFCYSCHSEKDKPSQGSISTGYGLSKHRVKICFACCGEIDKRNLRQGTRATLYLVQKEGQYFITNWPDSFSIPCQVSKGHHNIARVRYDASFQFEGRKWHSVTYGDNTQIAHCKVYKNQKIKQVF